MGFKEAMKNGKCNIHGPEKDSWVFHEYFMGFL